MAADALTTHRNQVTGPLHQRQWKGDAADSAFFFMENLEMRLAIVQIEARAIVKVLEKVKLRMEQAQTDLRNAVKRAEDNHYSVDADGWVSAPSLPSDYGSLHDPDWQSIAQGQSQQADQYYQWIQQAIKDAHAASDEGQHALSRLQGDILRQYNPAAMAETYRDVRGIYDDLGMQLPQIPEKPAEAKKWWDGLSEDEQRELIALQPELIGGADGLPSAVRNEANRLFLDQQLDIAQNDRTADKSQSGQEWNESLWNLEILRDRLNEGDGSRKEKELFLLNFDSSGDGRAVIAMGNPDTADHTAVLVPGTDTTMEKVPGQMGRIDKLQNAAMSRAPGESVSTILWLDYDAPEKSFSVLGPGRADDGADDLRRFTEGTRAAHGASRSHLTVIGHSYGSTTVGSAASGGHGLGADDIVMLGSPGARVHQASELQIDPSHVWAGASKNDPIAKWAPGTTLGISPVAEAFGAQRIRVSDGGHSSYWDDNSWGLKNQGAIIAGKSPTMGEYPHPDGPGSGEAEESGTDLWLVPGH
ncbi:hypothetical protein ACZ90_06910 [Streptomyces albus subsp. albus]|nr:hypothetical protein ACZ90_06910 [Streptomyces albus subsp. albus]